MRRAAALPLKAIVAAAVLLVAGFLVLGGRQYGLSAFELKRPQPVASQTAADPLVHAGQLVVPVQGVPVSALSDTFNDARAEGRLHDAIDIMAARGTLVLAAAPGRVEKLFLSKDGGNTAYVRSPEGRRVYYYAHLDRYAPGLREGMALRQGQPIGTVGATGNANPEAPHLHFAILATSPEAKWWDAKEPINPYPLLTGR